MECNEFFKDYTSYVSFQEEHFGKSTLFENDRILVGLNCMEPGQGMEKHAHLIQCRFYIVQEGSGQVWIGDEQTKVEKGIVVWVPAGQPHCILNSGSERMVMLVGIATAKAD